MEIEQLTYSKVTEGEQFLTRLLCEKLSGDYEIYIQPKLNGNRPDIIVLHREKGLFIIEIKDWKLERFHKDKKGHFFKHIYKNNQQKIIQVSSPTVQINRYKNFFHNYFINPNNILCFMYFHNATAKEAQNFIGEENIEFFGYDNAETIIHKIQESQNIIQYETIYQLLNPLHTIEMGIKIHTTSQQNALIEHKPGSWRRVKGAAGCGKTLVIAQKAGILASIKKTVLVVCYNITLTTYIEEKIREVKRKFDLNCIDVFHFHGLVRYINDINGRIIKRKSNFVEWEAEAFENFKDILKNEKDDDDVKIPKYDAILIDEGQDFQQEWFEILLCLLKPDGELLLVADDKQNIYERKLSWIDRGMKGQGYKFRGAWGLLSENKRIKSAGYERLKYELNRFANIFLKDYLKNNPDKSFGYIQEEPIKQGMQRNIPMDILKWIDLEHHNIEQTIFDVYCEVCKNFYNKDIAIVTTNKREVETIVEYFVEKGIKVEYLGKEENNKNSKKGFSNESQNIKIVNLHNYKGLEAKAIIFLTSNKPNTPKIAIETYIGITRAKECIVVLNRVKEYEEYGESWKRYESRS